MKPESKDKTDLYNSSVLERFSKFLDSHIFATRLVIIGIFGGGIVIIGRSIRIGTRFSKVDHVPKEFISRHIYLRGLIKGVDINDSTLYISHIPITRFIWFQTKNNDLLPVSLFGTVPTQSGVDWLKSNCIGREVWFQLMARKQQSHIDCVVTLKKNWLRNMCINTYLIENGLAKAGHVIDDAILDSTSLHYLNIFKKAEIIASRKQRGIWKYHHNTLQANEVGIISLVKKFVSHFISRGKAAVLSYFKHKK